MCGRLYCSSCPDFQVSLAAHNIASSYIIVFSLPGDGGLQSMLGNVDQQQLMQLLGSGGLSGLGKH